MKVLNNFLSAAIALFVIGVIVVAGVNSSTVYADGSGTTDACKDTTTNVLGSQEGTDDEITVDVGAGKIVTGVCIKSGNNMFMPSKHSVVLGNGTYEGGCYIVSGVGTQVVTVVREHATSSCQGLSHIDVVYEKDGTTCEHDCEQPCEYDCEQPCRVDCEEPEEPSEPEEPTTPQVLGTSTTAPTGGVSAGVAPAATGSLIGLSTSLGALGYGIRRLHKND